MEHNFIDSKLLRKMLSSGLDELLSQKEYINNLNVFPVPDGDTGINMSLTLKGGIDNFIGADKVGVCLSNFAQGTLLAARGNSGVILSQFFKGFVKDTEGLDVFTIDSFIDAISNGRDKAYESVAKPVEGTILTLMRDASSFLLANRKDFVTFEILFSKLIKILNESLQNTPKLLPVLAESGVVDSGAAGFLAIFKGMAIALDNKILSSISDFDKTSQSSEAKLFDNLENNFGYCTEFILRLHNKEDFSLKSLTRFLESIGESVIAIQDEDVIKVHVHTHTPDNLVKHVQNQGNFLTLKIENMALQHSEIISTANSMLAKKNYAVIAVASGEGICDLFYSLGVDVIVEGNQSSNPSALDFVNAIKKYNALHTVILPNNSNIISTAKQAASLFEDLDIRVIETSSIAEGFSSLSLMDKEAKDIDSLIRSMTYSLDSVISLSVAAATKNASINGITVTQGDFIGLIGDNVVESNTDFVDCAINLLEKVPDIEDKDVLTIFKGKNLEESSYLELEDFIYTKFPCLELTVIDGNQDVYDLIIAIE